MTEPIPEPMSAAVDAVDALFPPAPVAAATPAIVVPSRAELSVPDERSDRLAALLTGTRPRDTVLRAGAGLLATVPFAVAAGHGSDADLVALTGAMLGVPVSLALIALVGLAASTIGVSLLSSPIAPHEAADIGARGILRTGLVLLGLAPITALWVASYENVEALLVPSLAWGIAGVMGTATINVRFVRAVHPDHRTLSPGTIVVVALLTLFSVVLGIRLWFSLLDALFLAGVV